MLASFFGKCDGMTNKDANGCDNHTITIRPNFLIGQVVYSKSKRILGEVFGGVVVAITLHPNDDLTYRVRWKDWTERDHYSFELLSSSECFSDEYMSRDNNCDLS